MLTEKTMEKLRILAESAKYDVSCSSSGTVRSGKKGMVGNTVGGVGICHSFADDGRCISLLKVMLTNYCMYDCAYCINRRTNDIKRATLSVSELEEITMEFYRRNYIEGLFLSSGVVRNPDYTMERLTAIVRDLRTVHRFNGYIHLKTIPGASQELLQEAGRYADRMSVNIEIPKEESLKALAPEKDHKSIFLPMSQIQQGVLENKEDRRKFRHAPRFVPAGQSTQMIVGATKESDLDTNPYQINLEINENSCYFCNANIIFQKMSHTKEPIVINNPSEKLLEAVKNLKERKCAQREKLRKMKPEEFSCRILL